MTLTLRLRSFTTALPFEWTSCHLRFSCKDRATRNLTLLNKPPSGSEPRSACTLSQRRMTRNQPFYRNCQMGRCISFCQFLPVVSFKIEFCLWTIVAYRIFKCPIFFYVDLLKFQNCILFIDYRRVGLYRIYLKCAIKLYSLIL